MGAMVNYGSVKAVESNQHFKSMREDFGETYDSISAFLGSTEDRIKDYHRDTIDDMSTKMGELDESELMIRNAQNNFNNNYRGYQQTRARTENLNVSASNRMADVSPNPGIIPTVQPRQEEPIDTGKWNEQTPSEKNKILNSLKDHGLTDKDISNILNGTTKVEKTTLEQIRSELTADIRSYPRAIVRLEELLGFPILDADGNVDENRLKLAIITANKNLGMEIDLTPGSAFKKDLNELTVDLQAEYRKDPSIRTRVANTYGIDIFDKDGKVDQNKLTVVRLIDGMYKDDKYDIKNMIPKGGQSVISTPVTTPNTNPPTTDPVTDPGDNTVITAEPEVVDRMETITPGVDGIPEKATDSMKTSIKDGFGSVGEGILDAIEKGASRIARGISPYSGNIGATKGMNKATAGIIAAASVAAGGVATGGGILASKKLNINYFTPDDWNSLGADYQMIIEDLMRKVGFSTDDVETFKTSHFKISGAELRPHIRKIEKALDSNPTCDDELLKLYNYSMFDDNNKVIEYLLFITMIIDGRNTVDEYNMYNIINQSIDNMDDADFMYNGIDMEDYFDDTEDIGVKIINDPTEKTESEVTEEEKAEENIEEPEETNPSGLDKEWLQGIGIDD